MGAGVSKMQLIADKLDGARGGQTIFSDISFQLQSGEALTVIGPNGTGKSTMLRIVAGLLEPAGGKVEVSGGGDDWPDVPSACHFLSTDNALKPVLSVRENLTFWQEFHGRHHLDVDEALEMVGLEHTFDIPYGYLSTGQRRRIAICRLLVSYRPIWLLDEPTAGLDAASEAGFADLMGAHLEDGGMIIAATHLPLGLDGSKTLEMGAA